MSWYVFASAAAAPGRVLGGAKQSRRQPGARGIATSLLLLAMTIGVLLVLMAPRQASADPHAVFYTDRGQAQVFYNVLAALNQADYVEPPLRPDPFVTPVPQPRVPSPTEPPIIESDIRVGNFIATGKYEAPPPRLAPPRVTRDAEGRIIRIDSDPLEPLETQERAPLPRLRVRTVTSDDGDVYFRERLERRAMSEQMRVELGHIACRIIEGIYGPRAARDPDAPQQQLQGSPCFASTESLVFLTQ